MATKSKAGSSSDVCPSVTLFGRRKFISVSALSEVLAEIKLHGMPDSSSKSTIKRARDREFADESATPYGVVIQSLTTGVNSANKPVEFWYADPRCNIYYMMRKCNRLYMFFLATLEKHPSTPESPWTIIVYNDEILAGNPMLRHNTRKAWAFYYSFLEFGIQALSSEFLWFTLVVAKSDTVSSITGYGAGMLCKEMLLLFLPFASEGFVCGSVVLWARVGKWISDGDAIKVSFDLKGASGHVQCPKCSNVVSLKAAKVADMENCDLVDLATTDISKFHAHTDDTLTANAKFLQAQKLLVRPSEFAKLQTALGLNFAPDGVLLCDTLEFKISYVGFDYQHVYLVGGMFNVEAGFLLDSMKAEPVSRRVKHNHIHDWFQPFVWPFVQRHGKTVFETRSTSGGQLSCSASEALGCFLLLQAFLNLRVFDDAQDHVKAACCSYYALCTVLVMLTMTARGTVTPAQLMNAIQYHLMLHKIAYGSSHWRPKMHWALHLPEQLRRWKFLVACFTHERKHKEVKRYMQGRMNPHLAFDRNVLQDVLHVQSLVLNEELPYPSGTCLVAPKPARASISQWVQSQLNCRTPVETSLLAKVSGFTTVHVNDVVCIACDGDAVMVGQVFLMFAVFGECFAGVVSWPRTPQTNVYSTDGPGFFVKLHDIVDVCIYRVQDGMAFVVPPRGV
jgi:hypothetical protein